MTTTITETQEERDQRELWEERYLKAYLRYKAGLRKHCPSFINYGVTAERSEALRAEGKQIIAALREFAH